MDTPTVIKITRQEKIQEKLLSGSKSSLAVMQMIIEDMKMTTDYFQSNIFETSTSPETTDFDMMSRETTSFETASLEMAPFDGFKGVFVSSEFERILMLSFVVLSSSWVFVANSSIIWVRHVSDKLNQEYHYMLSICAFFNIMLLIPGKYVAHVFFLNNLN